MQVKVPYIILDELKAVLSKIHQQELITSEQHAIISGEVSLHLKEMITRTEERKKANELRQRCLSLAHAESRVTCSEIGRQQNELSTSMKQTIEEIRIAGQKQIAAVRIQMLKDNDSLQRQIEDLYLQIHSQDPDSDQIVRLIACRQQLQARSRELNIKAREKIADINDQTNEKIAEAKKASSAMYADTERRMRAARAALALARSIIENAPADQLPDILVSLEGKKGDTR